MAKTALKYIDSTGGSSGQVITNDGAGGLSWADQTGAGGGSGGGYDTFDRDGSSDIQPKATLIASYPFDLDINGDLMPTAADTWTDVSDFDYDGNNDIQALAT